MNNEYTDREKYLLYAMVVAALNANDHKLSGIDFLQMAFVNFVHTEQKAREKLSPEDYKERIENGIARFERYIYKHRGQNKMILIDADNVRVEKCEITSRRRLLAKIMHNLQMLDIYISGDDYELMNNYLTDLEKGIAGFRNYYNDFIIEK